MRIHLKNGDEAACRLKPNFYRAIKVTTAMGEVTCKRCKAKEDKRRRTAT